MSPVTDSSIPLRGHTTRTARGQLDGGHRVAGNDAPKLRQRILKEACVDKRVLNSREVDGVARSWKIGAVSN